MGIFRTGIWLSPEYGTRTRYGGGDTSGMENRMVGHKREVGNKGMSETRNGACVTRYCNVDPSAKKAYYQPSCAADHVL